MTIRNGEGNVLDNLLINSKVHNELDSSKMSLKVLSICGQLSLAIVHV